ncbi:MAG TPA: hypothetical protein VE737_08015 [Actinomycetota bacterium]|nr:hypothetical protein [Actinomycetota bacterium]
MNVPPVTAWLVRPGNPDAVTGTLSLERHALTFTPRGDEDPLPIPTNRIRRARRVRGSPILEVNYTDARAEPGVLFVYFAEPPPLPTTAGRTWARPTRGLQRTASAMALRTRSKQLRGRIDRWVRAIRDAAGIG